MSLREAMNKMVCRRESHIMNLFLLSVLICIALVGFKSTTLANVVQEDYNIQSKQIEVLKEQLSEKNSEVISLIEKNKELEVQHDKVLIELEKTREDMDNLITLYVPENINYVAKRASVLISATDSEIEMLERITEAEATGEGFYGKRLVCNVIINRVLSSDFPNTIKEVIFQSGQFSPIADGRYKSVKVTNETRIAVKEALSGIDYTTNALYFQAVGTNGWINKNNEFLFKHKNHNFYK